MNDLATFAEKWGWGVVLLVWTSYKFIPAFIERFMPEMLSARRDDRKAQRETEFNDRAALVKVYERFIAQNEMMIKFVGSATATISGMERALDGNTRMMAELVEAVKHGPSCPLPDCPFIQKDIQHGT